MRLPREVVEAGVQAAIERRPDRLWCKWLSAIGSVEQALLEQGQPSAGICPNP